MTLRYYCIKCGEFYDIDYIAESTDDVPKCAKCGGDIKPDVVLYEEGLNMDTLQKSVHYISNAQVLIIGGTSLAVYPAAGLIHYFNGKHLVLINKGQTGINTNAELVIAAPVGEVLSQIRISV